MNARSTKKVRRIEGIVTSTGGALSPGYALIVFLRPWREVGGPVQRKELRVEVPVASKAAVSRGMQVWDEKAVSLVVEQVSKASGNRLELNVARSRLRAVKPSPELLGLQKQQAKPKRVHSPVLGALELDRDMGWFEGQRRVAGRRYEVTLDVSDPDNERVVRRAVARAEPIVLQTEKQLPQLRAAIVAELLRTYNDKWRFDDKPALSATAFKRNLELQSVHLQSGRITAYFDAADMFADHIVEVRLSPRLSIQEVCISG